ncbi:cytochrome c3 family protein [Thiovibrio sp. JS02]
MLTTEKRKLLRPDAFPAVVVALVSLLAISGSGKAVGGTSPSQCCLCHQGVCEDVASKRYVHAPVLEQQCAVCHIADSHGGKQKREKGNQEKVRWLAKDFQADTVHWFNLPAELEGREIVVRADAGGREVLRAELNMPALAATAELPVPAGPPQITALRVLEVRQGVFLTARIAWKTDRIADSAAYYGEKDLNGRSPVETRLATDHEVVLSGLLPGRNYKFTAVSQDVFGNRAVSPEMTFSTRSLFSSPAAPQNAVSGKNQVSADYFRKGNQFLVQIRSQAPVAMMVGVAGGGSFAGQRGESAGGAGLPPEHLPLTDFHYLTVTTCYSCHPQAKGVLSHPVDVLPKRGMRIGREYRIQEDGRISCMSCHVPHASDNEYRLVKGSKKQLCVGCHNNMG